MSFFSDSVREAQRQMQDTSALREVLWIMRSYEDKHGVRPSRIVVEPELYVAMCAQVVASVEGTPKNFGWHGYCVLGGVEIIDRSKCIPIG